MVKDVHEKACTLLVRQMSDLPDALLQPLRATGVLEHVGIMVGFEYNNVCIGKLTAQVVSREADIGGNGHGAPGSSFGVCDRVSVAASR